MASAVVGALRVVLGLDSAAFTDGLSNAQVQLAKVGKSMQNVGRTMSTYVTAPILAAGGAITLAVTGMAKEVQELNKLAQVSGAGFEEFQRLAYAARTVGIESEKLADIYKDVNDRVGDFLSTGGGPMADFFENVAPKVGLTAEAFKDLSGPDALQAYYNALQEAGLNQQEMTFYLEAMASDVTALIPLLQDGGAAFRALGEEATVVSPEDAAGLQTYQDAMRQLGEAVKALTIALATSGILDFVTSLVTKGAEMVSWLAEVNPAVLNFGVVVAGLAAAIGPTLIVMGTMATALAAINAPLLLIAAGIAAVTAAVVIFWPEIQQAGVVVSEFVSGAWAQMLAAWDGMVLKVEEVKTAIAGFATWIVAEFQALPGRMLEIGGQIIQGLADGINAKWEEVKAGIANIPQNIANSFTGLFQIQSPSKLMHSIGGYIMEGLGNGMSDMAGGVTSIADDIASTIGSAFHGVVTGAKTVGQAISDVLGQLGQMLLNQGFQMLFGAGGGMGGGFGFIGSLFSGLFGFKNGGSFQVGGSGGVDSQLVAFKASPNERVTVTKPGQALSGAGLNIHVTTDDDRFRAFVRDESGQVVAESAPAIIGASVSQANRSAPGAVGKYQNQIAGGDYRLG